MADARPHPGTHGAGPTSQALLLRVVCKHQPKTLSSYASSDNSQTPLFETLLFHSLCKLSWHSSWLGVRILHLCLSEQHTSTANPCSLLSPCITSSLGGDFKRPLTSRYEQPPSLSASPSNHEHLHVTSHRCVAHSPLEPLLLLLLLPFSISHISPSESYATSTEPPPRNPLSIPSRHLRLLRIRKFLIRHNIDARC